MHRGGGTGLDGGKGGGAMGRNGYRREYRQADRGGYGDRSGGGGAAADNAVSKGSYTSQQARAGDQPLPPGGSPQAGISELEKRLAGVHQDFTQALHKISEKENEKFDLIFAILSELQSRQAQLEDSVRALKAQYGGGCQMTGPGQMVGAGTGPGSINGHQSYGQLGAQMGGQMSANMNGQQPMQQFPGVMQADGTQAMFTAVPQVVVVSSPNAAGMQYAMPQMMSPTGAMQPMSPQMAMQFMGQGSSQVPAASMLDQSAQQQQQQQHQQQQHQQQQHQQQQQQQEQQLASGGESQAQPLHGAADTAAGQHGDLVDDGGAHLTSLA